MGACTILRIFFKKNQLSYLEYFSKVNFEKNLTLEIFNFDFLNFDFDYSDLIFDILDFDLLDNIFNFYYLIWFWLFSISGVLICWFHAFRFLGVFGPQAGEALAIFFWKSSKLNKEFNEPIPRPPSGLESPQNWVLRYVVVKHAFFVFFLMCMHIC